MERFNPCEALGYVGSTPKACPQPCAQPDWELIGGSMPHGIVFILHTRDTRR